MNSNSSYLIFGLVILSFLGGFTNARQLPVHFFSLYDIPEDSYRDDVYYKEKFLQKSTEENENYQQDLKIYQDSQKLNLIRDLRAKAILRKNYNTPTNTDYDADNSKENIQIPNHLERSGIKDRTAKKSNNNKYYMSPCHFKICNMGRKRNIRHIQIPDAMADMEQK